MSSKKKQEVSKNVPCEARLEPCSSLASRWGRASSSRLFDCGTVSSCITSLTSALTLTFAKVLILLAERANAVVGPEVRWIGEQVEDRAQSRTVGWQKAEQEGEEGDVAFVANVEGFICE